ncbi:MAG: hypothetical protein NC300_11555 [Bacteroidales bacterium]|nr:hypothetical protein [Clostridium sp.]MCM1204767.1 hypothetical protein [Bacteroidales bacterium]
MERRNKPYKEIKQVIVFCLLLLLGGNIVLLNANAMEKEEELVYENIEKNIPQNATEYVRNNLEDIISIALYYAKDLGMEKIEKENAEIGMPYVIYELDNSNPDEIYYYPIIDKKNNKIALMVTVVGTLDGWSHTIDTTMVDELNAIKYNTDNYIFYKCEDTIVADNAEKEQILTGDIDSKCARFAKKDFEDKVDIISKKMNNYEKVDVDIVEKTSIEAYAPSFSTNADNSKILKMHNAACQGSKPTCWACSVATIVNYRRGTELFGMDVCEAMNRKPGGASIYVKQKALKKYGLNYSIIRKKQLSWSLLCSNIDSKWPVAISSFTSDGKKGHAVTAYGYRKQGENKYVVIWNSSGAGVIQIMQYKKGGSTYTFNQNTFIWKKSLSYK